jgi:ATP-binding cassette subfamily B (MDR/TAP) protein 1
MQTTCLQAIDFRFSNVLASLLSLVAGFILAFVYGWKMTLLVAVTFPLLIVGQAFRMRFRGVSVKKDNELMEEAGKV